MLGAAIGTTESWQQLRTVTPIRRLFAHLIDNSVWVGSIYWQFSVITRADSNPDAMLGEVIASTSVILALLVAYVIFAVKGRTLGKWILGIKIIKNDGNTAGFGTVFMRDGLGKIVSAVFLYLGFLWILLDSRNQGWHDKLMGTTVVYARYHASLQGESKI